MKKGPNFAKLMAEAVSIKVSNKGLQILKLKNNTRQKWQEPVSFYTQAIVGYLNKV